MTTRMILFIPLHLLTDPTNSTLPQTNFSLDLTIRIPPLRETTAEHFSTEMDFMVAVRSQEDEKTKFNIPN